MKVKFSKFTWLLAITIIGGLALTAYAGPHFQMDITFTPDHSDLTLNATGEIAGLGNADATVYIQAGANPTTTCTSPGGNQAAGQNPAPIIITGVGTVSPDADAKNGARSFTVTTDAPAQPTNAKTAGCPNKNWMAHIDDLCFTSATLTVKQGNRTVLTQTFNFNPCL